MAKVLIVEDEIDLVEMYKIQFELSSVKVATTDNLTEAFKLAKSFEPDVVLLDLLLDQKEVTKKNSLFASYGLLKKIKSTVKTKNINVIIFSNLDTQEHRDQAIKMGACQYLVKSEVLPKEIVEIVMDIINNK